MCLLNKALFRGIAYYIRLPIRISIWGGQRFTAARHPKSFISLDTADHLVTKRQDAEYVAHLLAAWALRYID